MQMAFGAASPSAGPQFHSEVIPEGYIVLRHVAVLPFEASLEPKKDLQQRFIKQVPLPLFEMTLQLQWVQRGWLHSIVWKFWNQWQKLKSMPLLQESILSL